MGLLLLLYGTLFLYQLSSFIKVIEINNKQRQDLILSRDKRLIQTSIVCITTIDVSVHLHIAFVSTMFVYQLQKIKSIMLTDN